MLLHIVDTARHRVAMEYLSFDFSSKSLALKKRDTLPKPAANEVRVKIAYSGICGTDLHILEVRVILLHTHIFIFIVTIRRCEAICVTTWKKTCPSCMDEFHIWL